MRSGGHSPANSWKNGYQQAAPPDSPTGVITGPAGNTREQTLRRPQHEMNTPSPRIPIGIPILPIDPKRPRKPQWPQRRRDLHPCPSNTHQVAQMNPTDRQPRPRVHPIAQGLPYPPTLDKSKQGNPRGDGKPPIQMGRSEHIATRP